MNDTDTSKVASSPSLKEENNHLTLFTNFNSNERHDSIIEKKAATIV